MLCDEVMLNSPKGTGRFIIVCDASDVGIGNALLQEQGDEVVLLEFGSKKLTPAERNWDVREKEAFAIKWSCDHYSDYLKGHKVLVITDHQSLRWMDNSNSGKIQRWSLFLQQFDLEIKAVPGLTNVVADWMSRSTLPYDEDSSMIDLISVPFLLLPPSSPLFPLHKPSSFALKCQP